MNIWGFPSDGIAGRTFSQYAEGAKRKSRSAKFNVALLIELRLCGSATHRKMLPLAAKRWLAFG
jgi:hypothetical protein